jgi:hypothetical protein
MPSRSNSLTTCAADAAAGWCGVGHRFCSQQAAERSGEGYVGLPLPCVHRDADAGACDIGAARNDLALLDGVIERAAVDDDVGRLPGNEAPRDAPDGP